jgi:hypothetical protein
MQALLHSHVENVGDEKRGIYGYRIEHDERNTRQPAHGEQEIEQVKRNSDKDRHEKQGEPFHFFDSLKDREKRQCIGNRYEKRYEKPGFVEKEKGGYQKKDGKYDGADYKTRPLLYPAKKLDYSRIHIRL